MPMPQFKDADKPAITNLTVALLAIVEEREPAVVLNALLSTYFNASVNYGCAADVPTALRSAADAIEQNINQVLALKANTHIH